MVEAVVVIPTLIVLFATLVFAHELYRAKLLVMIDTRQQVWTYASSNCGSEGDPGYDYYSSGADALRSNNVGVEPSASVPGGVTGGNADAVGAAGAITGSQLDRVDQAYWTASVSRHATVQANPILGGFQSTVSSTNKVPCNVVPRNGRFYSLVASAWRWGRQFF